jgi:hypothetical protein
MKNAINKRMCKTLSPLHGYITLTATGGFLKTLRKEQKRTSKSLKHREMKSTRQVH